MGKMFKEFGVPSLQAPNSHRRKKRLYKKLKRRRERYQGLQRAILPQDSLENRLRAFFNLNPGLSWTEITFFQCLAKGALKREGWELSRAHVGYGREFPIFCWSLHQHKQWTKPQSLWLLGVSEAAFDFEMDYVYDQVRH